MSAPEPLPFDGSPHTISIGVRRLDLDTWLDLDDRVDKVARKQRLLADVHQQVMGALPGSEDGGREVLDLVVEHLRARGLVEVPEGRSTGSGSVEVAGGIVRDIESGLVVSTTDQHPLEAASRLVGEDLCLMEVRPDLGPGYALTAASVCFPSRWRLADKLGASLGAIHAPVPGYDAIATATDRYFDAITVERPTRRVNWTLIDDPELFQPEPTRRDAAHAVRDRFDDPAHQVHLRIERQTMRRLPRTGGVLFTIATDVRPLAALTADQRADLAGSLEGVDPATVAYKGWSVLLPSVRAWLTP